MPTIVLGLIAALGATGVAVLGRVGLPRVDSVLATTLRAVVMAGMLIAVAGVRGDWQRLWSGSASLDARAWGFVIGAGACGAVSWLAYFAALKTGPAGTVATLDRLSLPLVFVLAALFLGEQPGWRGWGGLMLIVAGTMLILWDQFTRAG